MGDALPYPQILKSVFGIWGNRENGFIGHRVGLGSHSKMTDRKSNSADLKKTIRELAIGMVNVKHMSDTIKAGYGGDLEYEDYAVSTSLYDGSIFQVAKMKKYTSRGRDTGEFIENPYTENVVMSDKLNMTRKSNRDEEGWDEKRKNFESWAGLPAPDRMEKMLAFSKEHVAKQEARLAATKSFYATLSPEQQKIFDKGFTFGHRGGFGKRWRE